MLTSEGADINAVADHGLRDYPGYTPLHMALKGMMRNGSHDRCVKDVKVIEALLITVLTEPSRIDPSSAGKRCTRRP